MTPVQVGRNDERNDVLFLAVELDCLRFLPAQQAGFMPVATVDNLAFENDNLLSLAMLLDVHRQLVKLESRHHREYFGGRVGCESGPWLRIILGFNASARDFVRHGFSPGSIS